MCGNSLSTTTKGLFQFLRSFKPQRFRRIRAKYSAPGSTITIAASATPDNAQIRVLDEGPGIRDADLQRLFERFFRAAAGDHRRAGVGLGLASCKGFVEAMGGTIEAANRSDRSGAVFTITFPRTGAYHRAESLTETAS